MTEQNSLLLLQRTGLQMKGLCLLPVLVQNFHICVYVYIYIHTYVCVYSIWSFSILACTSYCVYIFRVATCFWSLSLI